MGFRVGKVLFAEGKIREHVLDGGCRFAHERIVRGENVMRSLKCNACRGKLAEIQPHESKPHQHFLQLDLLLARKLLSDLQRALPRHRGFGVAAQSLVDPSIGDVDVRYLRRLDAVLALEDRL